LQELKKYVQGGDKILDLGCGNGRLFELFKNQSVEYVGVDYSANLIDLAQKKYPLVKFITADALNLPFGADEFDVIFAVALLHHIPSAELQLKVLANCHHVLRPGGFLILTVWNLWQPNLLIKYKIWPMIFGWRPRGLDWRDVLIPWKMHSGEMVRRYYHAFCLRELKKLIKKSNFQIAETYYARRGQKTDWLKGFNLIVIAKKSGK
jgi:SAM-dependent methyltransferase